MINKSYEEILDKIVAEKGMSKEDVEAKINDKVKQLGDIISREGAAHIIANQLGVKLFEESFRKKWQIKDVIAGMSNVTLIGKVMNVYEIRSFKTGNREGRVASLLLGDESGVLRIVFWDERFIGMIEKQEIKEDTILKIKQAYSKENNGFIEIHVGGRTDVVVNPEGEKVDVVGGRGIITRNFSRSKLNEVKEGDVVEVLGTIVQIFELRSFLGCSECGRKINEGKCSEHGENGGVEVPVLNFYFDDGTENLQSVAFREVVRKLSGEKDVFEINTFKEIKEDLLGKTLLLQGRINKNQMFDRLEFSVNGFKEVNLEEEIKNA